ncbi:MAG: hypothetical protein IT372_05985 [Polyangiaceae bacterium]|nr:hypothetical protein [Polyangiaceae bacterium]
MIDEETGELELAGGVRVGPSFTEAQFLASPLARRSKAMNSPEWGGYRVERQRVFGREVRVTLGFRRGKLVMLELFLVGAVSKASWDEWSDREEVQRKADHDAWLEAMLGPPPYSYPWGEITSQHDPRGGYSSIVIRYGPAGAP